MAPITSRVAPSTRREQSLPSRTTKRQYQAAISMPGIEVRMPTISFASDSMKWRTLSITLSAFLLVLLYLAWTSPYFEVVMPQVSGNVMTTADEISGVLAAAGEPSFLLVPADMEARLRVNFPEITSSRIAITFPNELSVQVSERTPVIAWQQGNAYTWLDENGVAFRPQGSAENLITVSARGAPPKGLPVADDPYAPVPYVTTDMVMAIKELAPSVPSGATMLYDPRYGLGWADGRGWQVFFGPDASNLASKLQVYKALVDSLTQQGIAPAFISVEYANAPYYRMSQ